MHTLLLRFFFSLLVAMLFSGCQTLATKNLEPLAVEYPTKERLEFTGRGSAAAMMMSGSMGAMGIAIGVAIDEGISKDLHKSAMVGGFDQQAIITNVLGARGYQVVEGDDDISSLSTRRPSIKHLTIKRLSIKHLGFRSAGDLIAPWVEVVFTQEGQEHSLSYKELAGDSVQAADLNVLREDSAKAAGMIAQALEQVLGDVLAAN